MFQAVLCVNVRVDEENLRETISTLSFGDAARNIDLEDTQKKKRNRPPAQQDNSWVTEDF